MLIRTSIIHLQCRRQLSTYLLKSEFGTRLLVDYAVQPSALVRYDRTTHWNLRDEVVLCAKINTSFQCGKYE